MMLNAALRMLSACAPALPAPPPRSAASWRSTAWS